MLTLGWEEEGREMSRSTWISESSFATSSSRAGGDLVRLPVAKFGVVGLE